MTTKFAYPEISYDLEYRSQNKTYPRSLLLRITFLPKLTYHRHCVSATGNFIHNDLDITPAVLTFIPGRGRIYFTQELSGRSSVWLERYLGVVEVARSSRVAPTKKLRHPGFYYCYSQTPDLLF